MRVSLKAALILILVSLVACASGDVKPVPIEDGDMCSFCRMAISEKQYASEMITDDERVLKFDDIGCMLRYRKKAGTELRPAAIFVTDYETRQWIKAQDATFLRSQTIKTPMSSGIVAYADKARAGSEGVTFDTLGAE
jgi:copper chaperone NosL